VPPAIVAHACARTRAGSDLADAIGMPRSDRGDERLVAELDVGPSLGLAGLEVSKEATAMGVASLVPDALVADCRRVRLISIAAASGTSPFEARVASRPIAQGAMGVLAVDSLAGVGRPPIDAGAAVCGDCARLAAIVSTEPCRTVMTDERGDVGASCVSRTATVIVSASTASLLARRRMTDVVGAAATSPPRALVSSTSAEWTESSDASTTRMPQDDRGRLGLDGLAPPAALSLSPPPSLASLASRPRWRSAYTQTPKSTAPRVARNTRVTRPLIELGSVSCDCRLLDAVPGGVEGEGGGDGDGGGGTDGDTEGGGAPTASLIARTLSTARMVAPSALARAAVPAGIPAGLPSCDVRFVPPSAGPCSSRS